MDIFSKSLPSVPAPIEVAGFSVPILEWKGQRVVTLPMVDKLHGLSINASTRNFNRNRNRFIDGKHAFKTNCLEAKSLGITAPNGITLLTERGYLLLTQSFQDDRSYEIREMLIDCYFQMRALHVASRFSHKTPHEQRAFLNLESIPQGYFSMLQQMSDMLLRPMENEGYTLPAKLMPDIAFGLMFSADLKALGFAPQGFPTYHHRFLDGRPPVEARLYPDPLLPMFRQLCFAWLSGSKAAKYFKERDENAIAPLGLATAKMRAIAARYPQALK